MTDPLETRMSKSNATRVAGNVSRMLYLISDIGDISSVFEGQAFKDEFLRPHMNLGTLMPTSIRTYMTDLKKLIN